ncbi:calcium-binding protein [Intrasporangium sp.]|uniref:calcium-binding protein n=1 Tax=Intrasporangium sp. TaxID=1925024 RepID=UPI0032213F41
MHRHTARTATITTLAVLGALSALAATTTVSAPSASAVAEPGTPGPDVHLGLDNDNAANPFIQPPGVTAKQHMDNTDVLIGRGGPDLLVGNLGGDTLLGGSDSDILVGGPERFAAPNSDVLVGEAGDDVNIWAPGDGSDAFLGQEGYDTMVFAPFVTNPDGSLKLERYRQPTRRHRTGQARLIPRVDIDGHPQFSCELVPVPAGQRLGFQFLVRFEVNDVPVVTVRQRDVEKVFCPAPESGTAQVADLTERHPAFRTVPLRAVKGTVGAILAPAG